MPDIDIEGWWTSLSVADYDDVTIIVLYRDHSTAEQSSVRHPAKRWRIKTVIQELMYLAA